MKKGIIFIIVLLVVLAVLFFIFDNKKENSEKLEIVDFVESCLQANNVIFESYPRQCRTIDGRNFVEEIGNELEKADLIIINNLRPNQKISSPLEIDDQARGFWFFEADFPIVLVDNDGQTIAQTIATAQSEWMTEDFVSFSSQF